MILRALSSILLATAALTGAPALTQPAAPQGIDPQARSAIERMRAYLRTLGSFEVRAESTIEEAMEGDVNVDLASRVRYEYRAPDKLLAEWRSDRQSRRLYYDGKTLTVLAPPSGYYASIPASGSVGSILTRAAEDYGIVFPLPDLFLWAVADAPALDVTSGSYLGYARVAGADTDHYIFRQPQVDWQIWIERGERPLPRKVVITDRVDPQRPTFSALLQWNPNVPLTNERFVFTPNEATQRIEIVELELEGAQ